MRLLSIFGILLLTACYQPERNCQDFKTGTFEFETLVGSELLKTTFVRTREMEIDYFQGKADSSSIRWINDCEYIVKKINPKNRSEEKAVHMKILTTDGNSYTFEYSLVGQTRKERGKAVKVGETTTDPKQSKE